MMARKTNLLGFLKDFSLGGIKEDILADIYLCYNKIVAMAIHVIMFA